MSLKPVAILAYGNPSRGDDALAPCLLDRIELMIGTQQLPDTCELINDFQLQIEHTLDLQGRSQLLFIDASMNATAPFEFSNLQAAQDDSISSHALSPAALLTVYEQVHQETAPPAFLLAIPGYEFELGEPLSTQAENNLQQAADFCIQLLRDTRLAHWKSLVSPLQTHC